MNTFDKAYNHRPDLRPKDSEGQVLNLDIEETEDYVEKETIKAFSIVFNGEKPSLIVLNHLMDFCLYRENCYHGESQKFIDGGKSVLDEIRAMLSINV